MFGTYDNTSEGVPTLSERGLGVKERPKIAREGPWDPEKWRGMRRSKFKQKAGSGIAGDFFAQNHFH